MPSSSPAHVLGIGRGAVQAAAVRGDALDARGRRAARGAGRAARDPRAAAAHHRHRAVPPPRAARRPRRLRAAARDRDRRAARDRRARGRGIPLPDRRGSRHRQRRDRPRAGDRGAARAGLRRRELASTRSSGPRRTSRASAPTTRTLAFIDLEHAFPELDGTVSVVVSNPPYVPDAAIPRDPEVRFFDPPAALYGGADGLDVVRVRERRRAAPRAPRRHDRDRARRVAGRGDPRHSSPPTAGAPPRRTPTSRMRDRATTADPALSRVAGTPSRPAG